MKYANIIYCYLQPYLMKYIALLCRRFPISRVIHWDCTLMQEKPIKCSNISSCTKLEYPACKELCLDIKNRHPQYICHFFCDLMVALIIRTTCSYPVSWSVFLISFPLFYYNHFISFASTCSYINLFTFTVMILPRS